MTKAEKKVRKVYPNAKLGYDDNGYRVIKVNDLILSEEYFLPDTYDDNKAWEYAAVACTVSQNFNRTHPLRMDLSSLEEKIQRIENRKTRGRNANKKNSK